MTVHPLIERAAEYRRRNRLPLKFAGLNPAHVSQLECGRSASPHLATVERLLAAAGERLTTEPIDEPVLDLRGRLKGSK